MKLTLKIFAGIFFIILITGAFTQESKIDHLEKKVASLEKRVLMLEKMAKDKTVRIIPLQKDKNLEVK